jgi:type II secretory pathway component PulF
MQKILTRLAADVDAGVRLSECMTNHPKVFMPHFVAIIRAGEEKGEVKKALSDLADLIEKNHALTEGVKEVRGKPLLKFFVGSLILAYFFLLFPVVLRWISSSFWYFRDSTWTLIAGYIEHLPISIRSLFFILLLVVIILVLCVRMMSGYALVREIRERIVLRLPITGKLMRNVHIAKFVRTLGTLLASGIPKTKSFNTAIEAIDSPVFSRALGRVRGEISDSAAIVPSLERAGVFPPATLRIVATGEQAGALEAALINAADVSAPSTGMRYWSLSERLFFLAILAFIVFMLGGMFASVVQRGSCGSRGGG